MVITRPRHPLVGQELRVLGRIRRHGRLECLVVLPDGSKRFIPQIWTDAEPDAVSDGVSDAVSEGSTLGSLEDLLAACALVAGLATA